MWWEGEVGGCTGQRSSSEMSSWSGVVAMVVVLCLVGAWLCEDGFRLWRGGR